MPSPKPASLSWASGPGRRYTWHCAHVQFTHWLRLAFVLSLYSLWSTARSLIHGRAPGEVPVHCDSNCGIGGGIQEDWCLLDRWCEPASSQAWDERPPTPRAPRFFSFQDSHTCLLELPRDQAFSEKCGCVLLRASGLILLSSKQLLALSTSQPILSLPFRLDLHSLSRHTPRATKHTLWAPVVPCLPSWEAPHSTCPVQVPHGVQKRKTFPDGGRWAKGPAPSSQSASSRWRGEYIYIYSS